MKPRADLPPLLREMAEKDGAEAVAQLQRALKLVPVELAA